MNKLYRTIVPILFCVFCSAQNDNVIKPAQTSVILEKGLVTLDDKPWLTVTETPVNRTTTSRVVKNLSGDIIAQLTFENKGDKVFFQGEFASVEKKYEINYPVGTTIQTILESYNKNKVIVDGKIDVLGLQNYCHTRKIRLMKIFSVALEDKKWLIVTETPINKTISTAVVKNLSGDIIAQLTFENKEDKVFFQGEFASVEKKYEINYPAGTTIQTILESYNKNEVIVGGKINVAGLQSYCKSRNIPLTKILSAEEQRKYNDSLKKIGKRFSFAIYGGGLYSFRDDRSGTRTLKLSNPYLDSYTLVNFPSSRETGVTTGNLGIYFEFRLRKHVFLNIGLNYARIYYQTKDNTTIHLTSVGDAFPYPQYSTTTTFQIKENYYITSLPICWYYRLNGKINYYTFGGGASLAAFRNVVIEAAGPEKGAPSETFGGTDPIGIMGTLFARIGIFHRLGRNMSVGFESEIKCYLTYDRLYTLGGNLVLKF